MADPIQYAGLLGPAYVDIPIGPTLDEDGSLAIDYAASTPIIVRVSLIRPDNGAVQASWASDADPATLAIQTVEPDLIVARHTFHASIVELPWISPPLVEARAGRPMKYRVRFDFVSAAGMRLMVPSSCLWLYNLDAPCC